MRLIRLKIKSAKVRAALKTVASQFRTGDVGFVEDLYALIRLKGKGMPTKVREDALIKALSTKGGMSAVNARIAVKKRVHVLSQAKSTAYFKALTVLPDPIDAARRLLVNFQKLYLKYREVQCLTCQFRPNCDFGKQYQDKTTDIRRVVDPDFKKKVHAQCPVLPEVEAINQLASAVNTHKQMAKKQGPESGVAKVELDEKAEEAAEDESEIAVKDGSYEDLDPTDNDALDFHPPAGEGYGTHTAGSLASHRGAMYVRHFEDMTKDLNREQLVIFELGAKLGQALIQHKKGQFTPTADPAKERRTKTMESVADITKLVPSEHGKPDEVFEKGVLNKELVKREELEPKKKRPLLYLLLDESFSMRGYIPANSFGMLSRGGLAAVFAMALIRHVEAEGGIVFLRFFAGSPSPLLQARTPEEFQVMLHFVSHCDFNGGGTQIAYVLDVAATDIATAQNEISKSELILISDVEDQFSVQACRKALKGNEVNVLDVAAIDPSLGVKFKASNVLKNLAKKYYKVDPTTLSVADIISVV